MPKWGLSEAQRTVRPWGLDLDLLMPAKTITDPVHGDVYVTKLERLLLDSPPMQRLRRIYQLGTTHLVYPSATHSRFSHALGTLRAAQDLLDAVADNRRGPRHIPDLLDEWDEVGELDLRFAEATVLARVGALLHDLCHVPLGHTIEDDLKVLIPHDQNEGRFELLWAQLDDTARRAIESAESRFPDAELSLMAELRRLILSKADTDPGAQSSYPFVGDIVGNTICADLIDYLQRDHTFTGLPIALGHRFVDDFYVMDSQHVHFAKRMVVRITRYGHPREDVVTELVKYLRYRYELTERVLTHHTKIAADAMIGKLLEMWNDAVWIDIAAGEHPNVVAQTGRENLDAVKRGIFEIDPTALEERHADLATTEDPRLRRSRALKAIDDSATAVLETEFLRHSDDGLLEYLAGLGGDERGRRYNSVAKLALDVLDRRLFKLVGRADSTADLALAEMKYKTFGTPAARRRIEQKAAKLAGLEHGWQAVVWLPNPDMRLKVAEVLVRNEEGVAPLDRVSDAGGHIVDQHRRLWAISVFVSREILNNDNAVNVLLSSLKTDMDVGLTAQDGTPIPTIPQLAEDVVATRGDLDLEGRQSLRLLVPAAQGGSGTFQELVHRLWLAGEENGLIASGPPDDLWQ